MTWDYELYIDGQQTPSDGDGRITVLDPATEEVIGSVPDSTGTDMQRAIAAARRAFDEGPWPWLKPAGAFGGFKQSGIGREWGGHGLAEFTELKAITWS